MLQNRFSFLFSLLFLFYEPVMVIYSYQTSPLNPYFSIHIEVKALPFLKGKRCLFNLKKKKMLVLKQQINFLLRFYFFGEGQFYSYFFYLMVYRVSCHLKILNDVTLLDIFVFVVFDLNYRLNFKYIQRILFHDVNFIDIFFPNFQITILILL